MALSLTRLRPSVVRCVGSAGAPAPAVVFKSVARTCVVRRAAVRLASGGVAPAKRGLVGTYVHWLDTAPLVTKSVTSMVIGYERRRRARREGGER